MYLGSSSSSSGSSLHSRRSFLVCFLHDRQFRMWIRCRKAGVRRLSGPVQHQGPLPDPSVLRCLSIEAHLTNEILIDYDISNASNFLREREKKKEREKKLLDSCFDTSNNQFPWGYSPQVWVVMKGHFVKPSLWSSSFILRLRIIDLKNKFSSNG